MYFECAILLGKGCRIDVVKSKYDTINCYIEEEEKSELLIYAAASLNKLCYERSQTQKNALFLRSSQPCSMAMNETLFKDIHSVTAVSNNGSRGYFTSSSRRDFCSSTSASWADACTANSSLSPTPRRASKNSSGKAGACVSG